ncbi:MAG TPA: hypothetical protein VNS32_14560 [Flavisolibacter sp.]|nr:hypothetical protein [Flavisolibacter sp.]
MTQTLYVDIITENKSMALTSNSQSVSHNLAIINQLRLSSSLFHIGRYICIIQSMPDNKKVLMFFETRLAHIELNEMLNSTEYCEQFRNNLASVIHSANAEYETAYNIIELVKKEPHTQHLHQNKESTGHSIFMTIRDLSKR